MPKARPKKIKKAKGYTKSKLQIYIHPAAMGKLIALAKKKGYVGKTGDCQGKAKPARMLTAWIEKELGLPQMTRSQREKFMEITEAFDND